MTPEQFNETAQFVRAIPVEGTWNFYRVYDITGRERAAGPWWTIRATALLIEDELADVVAA